MSVSIAALRVSLSMGTDLKVLKRFNSTIFALSSGYGKCGVGVIRISGPDSLVALKSMSPKMKESLPRIATLQTLFHPLTREKLDRALTLWFPGPNSFTGEDCVELHVHGSVAVVNAVLEALSSIKVRLDHGKKMTFI